MEYINHFEIESKRPGGRWEHVGNCYPKYQWRIWRPWYLLWLRKQKIILNEMYAWTSLLQRLCRENADNPESREKLVWYFGYDTALNLFELEL